MKRLAILLTCFNRKESTLKCLQALTASMQYSSEDMETSIYLVDDGSTDGTADAITTQYPEIILIKGNGSLYWAGGMRAAWKDAMKSEFDYYLLLNDDTFLFKDALVKLFYASEQYKAQTSKEAIFVGSTVDRINGKQTYGGRKLYSNKSPVSYLIQNEKTLAECDLGNGNIMLVPHTIVKSIGILSEKFIHAIADHDYTLRAKEHGFKVFVVPGVLGICKDDSRSDLFRNANLSGRIRFLYSHKGISYKEYLYFIRSHFPGYLPKAYCKLWIKTLAPNLYEKLKIKRKEMQRRQKIS